MVHTSDQPIPLHRVLALLTHFQHGFCEVGTDFTYFPAKLHTQKLQHNVLPSSADTAGETKRRISSTALLRTRLSIIDFFTSQLSTPCPNYLYERTRGHCLKNLGVIKRLLACNKSSAPHQACPFPSTFFLVCTSLAEDQKRQNAVHTPKFKIPVLLGAWIL